MPADAWYAPYVNWAAANRIVSGTSATTFDPNATISRQDMAVMLYNYAQRYDVTLNEQTVTPFTDESAIADYALPAVQALHSAGVISGMPDGSFQPYATATPRTGLHRAVHAVNPALQRPRPKAGGRFCMRTQVSALPCGRYGHVSKNLTRERI